MAVPFILMTIACAILILTEILQHRKNKRLTKRLEEINEKGWREVFGFGKVYNTHRRFIVIDNAGDNETLNRMVERYRSDGYEFDNMKSTDRLLVFVKHEAKEKFIYKKQDGESLADWCERITLDCQGRSLEEVYRAIREVGRTFYMEGAHNEKAMSKKYGKA